MGKYAVGKKSTQCLAMIFFQSHIVQTDQVLIKISHFMMLCEKTPRAFLNRYLRGPPKVNKLTKEFVRIRPIVSSRAASYNTYSKQSISFLYSRQIKSAESQVNNTVGFTFISSSSSGRDDIFCDESYPTLIAWEN